MVFPQPFTTTTPNIISYDYQDISDGANMQIFYACAAVNSAGTTYFLTTETIEGGNVSAISTSTQNHDYDFEFQIPRTIKGTAFLSASIGANATAPTDRIMTVTATLYHWDGTTETSLSATQTSAAFTITQATQASRRITFKIPITTEKHFKEGDSLRLTMITATTQGSGQYGYGHNPSGGLDDNEAAVNQIIESTDSTKLMVHVPFKLE